MAKRYQDKVIVVTGAGGGLGRALALGYAAEGAKLVITDVDAERLKETEAELKEKSASVSSYQLDLASEDAIKACGADICAAHDEIAVLFNNAGIAYGAIHRPIEMIPLADWQLYFTINTLSPLILSEALRPALVKGKGVILNQASMAGYAPANAYGITKASLMAMTHAMSLSFGGDGIRVNAIAPGLMETPASKESVPAENYAQLQAMQAIRHHGVPEDIVRLALFLSSDDAGFITGETVSCDGGSRLKGWHV